MIETAGGRWGSAGARLARRHVPESVRLFPAVRDVEDGNTMRIVPRAQVFNDLRLGRQVQRGQRLIQQ